MQVETKELTYDESIELVDNIGTYNNLEYNMLKVVEEATELNELLLKYVTKSPKLRPKTEDIVEEAGDLMARLFLLILSMGLDDQVEIRTESKLAYIYDMMKKGVYGTHITVQRNDPKDEVTV